MSTYEDLLAEILFEVTHRPRPNGPSMDSTLA